MPIFSNNISENITNSVSLKNINSFAKMYNTLLYLYYMENKITFQYWKIGKFNEIGMFEFLTISFTRKAKVFLVVKIQ